jgi:small subunit ribosomal protein S1
MEKKTILPEEVTPEVEATEVKTEETVPTVETEVEEVAAEIPAPEAEEVVAATEEVAHAVEETAPATVEETVIEEAPSRAKKEKAPVVEAEFDWDAYEKGDNLSAQSKAEMEKIYDNTLTAIKDKEVVEGSVISINKREVVINVGYKSDGIVPMGEFRYNPDLKVGDKVEVYIESQEDKKGQLLLSHKQARATRSWDKVNAALESQEIVKGYIKCRTKGGMIVDVFGIEAFLPGSQIDVKPIRDYDIFVGKTMEFKVVKINYEFRNVVVSHKALIEANSNNKRKKSSAGCKKVRYSKALLKTSLPTAYLSIWAASTA